MYFPSLEMHFPSLKMHFPILKMHFPNLEMHIVMRGRSEQYLLRLIELWF